MGEFFAYTESIRKSGHYVGGNALQPTYTATTLRVRNGARLGAVEVRPIMEV